MQNNQVAIVRNYCGYPVEVIDIKGYVNDPERGRLVRAQIRYEDDGFIASALLKESEIEFEIEFIAV